MEHTHENNTHDHAHMSHRGKFSWFTKNAETLERMLLPIFHQAPHMPGAWRNLLVTILPWLSLIFGALGIIGFLGAQGLAIILSPILTLSYGIKGITILLGLVIGLATSVLSVLAFKPLQAHSKRGWDYIFYGLILSVISLVMSLLFVTANVSSLVFIAIGAYLLFEVRERYH